MDTGTTSSEHFLASLQPVHRVVIPSIPASIACVAVTVKNMASQSSRCFSLSTGRPAQEVPVWPPRRSVSSRLCNCLRARVCAAKGFVAVVKVLFQLTVACVRTAVSAYGKVFITGKSCICLKTSFLVQPKHLCLE